MRVFPDLDELSQPSVDKRRDPTDNLSPAHLATSLPNENVNNTFNYPLNNFIDQSSSLFQQLDQVCLHLVRVIHTISIPPPASPAHHPRLYPARPFPSPP